ncbi:MULTISPECIES: hypothetical protein [unclassified Halomonas]|uniref:hypothetical protein n=1 Tax=unclassified Halomonas TaxID=2609666 RepID=UPI004034A9D8
MTDEHKAKIGVPAEHSLVQTGTKWEQRKGKDTDHYFYDELDSDGSVVAKYKVSEAMSIYPPFGTTVSWEKL